MSGADRLRPGYQKLLEDARAGEFDVVVAEALDRLSRDQEDVAGALQAAALRRRATIVTLTEGEISELHVGLKGTMNALYLKDLAEKTRRGLRGRVEAGRSAGGRCYGYDVVCERDAGRRARSAASGRSIRMRRRSCAASSRASPPAKVPRRIAVRSQPRGRARTATAAPGARPPSTATARGTGILNNELYIGRLVWNRLRYVKDPETGKRVSRPNPPEQLIVQEVPELAHPRPGSLGCASKRGRHRATRTHPARSQGAAILGSQATALPALRPRPLRRLRRQLRQDQRQPVRLRRSRNKGTCTNRLNIRRDALEAIVLDGLKSRLMDPELFKAFAQEFVAEVNRLRGNESAKAEQLKRERDAVEKRIRRIVDAIAEGVPARSLKDELMALEQRQEELEHEIARGARAAAPAPPQSGRALSAKGGGTA